MSTNEAMIRAHLVHLRRTDARPDTLRHREANLRRLANLLPVDLADATLEHLWAWQDDLRAGRKIATVRCYTSHARAFYQWAAREGRIDRDPSVELRTPRVPPGRARPIAEDQLRVAITCAPDTAELPLRTWLVLAAYCGLRAGEIARLTAEAIQDEVLEVDGKGGRPRTVPLPAAVRAMLLAHVQRRQSGPIWQYRTGRPLTPNDVTKLASRHLHGTGADCSLHKLRHRYATRINQIARDPMLVKELLGHTSLSTTQVYLAVDARLGQRAVQKLAEGLEPRKPARRRRRRDDPDAPLEEAS